jgi:Tol biopolymer transport system component
LAVISSSRRKQVVLALAVLLSACGESPVEVTSRFPAGVTGQLAFVSGKSQQSTVLAELHVLDASGRERVTYSTASYGINELTWAPDGRHLAFHATLPGIGSYQPALYGIGIGDQEAVRLFEHDHEPPEESPRYSRSGRLAYEAFTSGGPGVPPPYYGIFIDGTFAFPGLGKELDWRPDEQALVLSDSTDLLRLRLADGTLSRIWSAPGYTIDQPAVSPDGAGIAFLRYVSVDAPTREVWTVGIDGSAPIQLTTGHLGYYPVWTADGRYVAFRRYAAPGSEGVYLVPALGGTATRLVALADNTGGPIAWSR